MGNALKIMNTTACNNQVYPSLRQTQLSLTLTPNTKVRHTFMLHFDILSSSYSIIY